MICPRVDGGNSTYTTADLNAIKALLQPQATAYLVTCYAAANPPDADPCWNGAMIGEVKIRWTSDDVTSCDGVCGGSGCMAGTAEAVE